ncbi:MAG TPA: DUF456 domain-containing protein [Gemmatimonadaceae bacterium]|nr:DUF456 domain-containing protein [Gemmatimonadaceae bacterium]
MPQILLLLACLAALLLVPLGLPGLWVMVGIGFVYNWLVGTEAIGWLTLAGAAALALLGEVIETLLGARFTRRYGGSRRAAWGAVIGGIAGAIVGVPVPVVGSMVGAFAGAFVGALVAEYTVGRAAGAATRVATGALLGRAAAVAVKVGIGCAIAAWLVLAAWT